DRLYIYLERGSYPLDRAVSLPPPEAQDKPLFRLNVAHWKRLTHAADVRFGSKADIWAAKSHVRVTLESGPSAPAGPVHTGCVRTFRAGSRAQPAPRSTGQDSPAETQNPALCTGRYCRSRPGANRRPVATSRSCYGRADEMGMKGTETISRRPSKYVGKEKKRMKRTYRTNRAMK